MTMMKSLSRLRHGGCAWRGPGPASSETRLAAAIADGRGVIAADFGGDGVDREASLAGKALGFGNRLEWRKHQQLAACAGVEVIAARLEIRPEATWNNRDERQQGAAQHRCG